MQWGTHKHMSMRLGDPRLWGSSLVAQRSARWNVESFNAGASSCLCTTNITQGIDRRPLSCAYNMENQPPLVAEKPPSIDKLALSTPKVAIDEANEPDGRRTLLVSLRFKRISVD